MSITFKTLEQNLPEEMVQYIAELKHLKDFALVINQIKTENRNCLDTGSYELLKMICSPGTFQINHLDEIGKKYKIIISKVVDDPLLELRIHIERKITPTKTFIAYIEQRKIGWCGW